MSSDDERDSMVRQRKEGTAAVTWREYEALRDHLSRQFNHQCDKLQNDLTATDMKLENVLQTANDSAATLTTIQASLATLTRAVQGLTQRQNQPVDDASIHGAHGDEFAAEEEEEDEDPARVHHARHGQQPHANGGRGGGRGGAPPGRGFAPVGARRNLGYAANGDDDVLGKPKFNIPNLKVLLTWKNTSIGS